MKALFLLFFSFASLLSAAPMRHEFNTESDRCVYYLESPDVIQYPIILLVDGSFSEKAGPMSILWLEEKFAASLLPLGIGVLAMEKCGVDGDLIDVEFFHRHNTPSHRLANHIQLVKELRTHPPRNWNGKLVIVGGSEGGPIAIKIAEAVSASACVALVGCGDQTFKEYIWNFLQTLPEEVRLELLPATEPQLPGTREAYEVQIKKMKANSDPLCFWLGQSYFYWADALDQREDREFFNLKCPILVVAGSEDVECASTDRLIDQAKKNHRQVTYLRVEGMGHTVLDPKWQVMEQIQKFLAEVLYPHLYHQRNDS